jgi:FtsP/CotA-like multicopper oxidase with cupredoxin domain
MNRITTNLTICLPIDNADPAPLSPFADRLSIPVIKRPYQAYGETWSRLKIRMMPGLVEFHSELAPVPTWTYEGIVPGPTIEVTAGQKIQIEWVNELKQDDNTASLLPIKVVKVEEDDRENSFQNSPGSGTGIILAHTEDLQGWSVIHLHGGRTTPENDGWPENTAAPGQTRLYEYESNQRGTQLWYHDHAIHVTRLNVYSGLAGLWTIRDEAEANLNLPQGEYEVPLFIQDFNFETVDGRLDAPLLPQLLHKTIGDVPEFFGPFTAVNGTIWPYLAVEKRWYRLRLLNASNARTYRLSLYDQDGQLIPFNPDAIVQIGCDQGLLDRLVELPPNGLILASGERADILIDFSQLPHHVTAVTLVNTAPAPFDGSDRPAPDQISQVASHPDRLRWPWVMQFQLKPSDCDDRFNPDRFSLENLPTPLSAFQRIDHAQIPEDHQHRLIALVEVNGEVTLRELEEYDPMLDPNVPSIIEIQDEQNKLVAYKTVAANFDDATTIFVAAGDQEVWKFINLTGDTHPIHIHQVEFQALKRQNYNIDSFDSATGETTMGPIVYASAGNFDANEQGPKDVIRVNPRELVSIVATFGPFTGRYIYHCHILEHEDHDMMRTFVILPRPVLESHLGTHGGNHGGGNHGGGNPHGHH